MYPSGYLDNGICVQVTPERIIETVHRLEEDMTDHVTIRKEWHVKIQIGPAMVVDPEAKKSRDGDPLTIQLRQNMLQMLGVQDWWRPVPVTNA